MVASLHVADDAFEFLWNGTSIGHRRFLDSAAVAFLHMAADRYRGLLCSRYNAAGLLTLGRELYGWLNGDGRQMARLREVARPPFVLEVASPRQPSLAGWALLSAPWEILADDDGFLAGDALLRFCPVRRLGPAQPEPPADDFRLGLMFMAAAPRGQQELDYDAEEAAILRAARGTPASMPDVDLWVEDSGDPVLLSRRLGDLGTTIPALHLSCHGDNAWRPGDAPDADGQPVLLLEDAEGNAQPTDAPTLLGYLKAAPPRLLFLSACLSSAAGGIVRASPGGVGRKDAAGQPPPARAGEVSHSLATALVSGGLPAVLGWEGSVADRAATLFASALYAKAGGRLDLAEAVADARRDLLGAEDEVIRADWHLARLWLGSVGGGSLVKGRRKRSLLPATHGHQVFLDRKQQVPVASPEMFVGRRRVVQTTLQSLADGRYGGVLLHGIGRVGKSSVAVRIAGRCKDDLALAVVVNRYNALSVVEALEEALSAVPDARSLLEAGKPRVREERGQLAPLLIDLLNGPCRQSGPDAQPVLLVIDDLEQILEADPGGGRHRIKEAAHAEVLAMVLRAFDPARTDSRLLVTSRFPFRLDGLEDRLASVHVGPLTATEQAMLQLRQKQAAETEPDRAKRLADDEVSARSGLLDRAREVGRGNPGLQDLIGRQLVLPAAVPVAQAEAAIAEMEAWLAGGDLPAEAEVRAFLESIAIDRLLALADENGRALLRAATVFEVPVPRAVLEAMSGDIGGDLVRLEDLGLIDPFEDMVDHHISAGAVNELAAARLLPPDDDETAAVADVALPALLAAWGGLAAAPAWPPAAHYQVTRLALAAGDPDVVGACAARAMDAPRMTHAKTRAAFGQACIALLDRNKRPVPWRLLSFAATAAAGGGDGMTADELFARGEKALATTVAAGAAVHPLEATHLLYAQARRLHQRGDFDAAEALYRQAAEFAAKVGDEINVAIAHGGVAGILFARGDVDGALRTLREDLIPVFERLGAVREIAITKGRIADILFTRGNFEDALRMRQEEELPVFERLGDMREIAITKGQIADILFARGDVDAALRIRQEEELPVFERLGAVREVAVIKGKIADILFACGDVDAALRIRQEEELSVFERLGAVAEIAITKGQIADILFARGDVDAALRIWQEEVIPIFERIGGMREVAVAKSKIADILAAQGDLDGALRIRQEEELPVFERLGAVREVAVTKGKIADILAQRGALDEALHIRTEEELPVFERIGDMREVAVAKSKIADILAAQGDLDGALRIRQEEVIPVFKRLGAVREGAVAKGKIADILATRGDVDAALRIRQEEELPVFERLGAVREGAVAKGKIADILAARGDVDAARQLWIECLETSRKLQALDGIAASLWGLVRLDLAEKKVVDAALRLREAFTLMLRLGQAEGLAVVGNTLGQLMVAAGAREEARKVLKISADAYRKLGRIGEAEQVESLLRDL